MAPKISPVTYNASCEANKAYKGPISAGCAALSKAVSLPKVRYFHLGIVDELGASTRGHARHHHPDVCLPAALAIPLVRFTSDERYSGLSVLCLTSTFACHPPLLNEGVRYRQISNGDLRKLRQPIYPESMWKDRGIPSALQFSASVSLRGTVAWDEPKRATAWENQK